MWVGSLVIATIFAIPSYFLTRNAIVRFRASPKLAKLKQSTTKLRESTKRIAQQFRIDKHKEES